MIEFQKTFDIKGMHCASCVRVIEKTLQKIEGVQTATVNLATNKATVSYNDQISINDMSSAVKKAGYELMMEEKPMGNDTNQLKQNVLISFPLVFISFVVMFWEIFFPMNSVTGQFFHHLLPL